MNVELVKRRMAEKKLSQKDLARRFDKAPSTIHYLCNGELKSEDLERRLARALGITLEELRGDGDGV